jgi:hypothetical protein
VRSRSTLHMNKLAEFRAYLESRGWINEPPKTGVCEVLRMRHPNSKTPCIVHKKDSATQHLTTWGTSQNLLRPFLKESKTK